MVSWSGLRAEIIAELRAGGVEAAEIEARWITEHVSGARGVEWFESEGMAVPTRLQHRVALLVQRRIAGEPLQYVLGEWAFRDIDVVVDPRVLIPRPETEWVVEIALQEARRVGLRCGALADFGVDPTHHVADLGTGSGVIAISLERALPDVTVWASDLSPDALDVARRNAIGNACGRVRTLQGSWFAALPVDLQGSLSLIVSNPPYISEDEFDSLPSEVRGHEPYGALISGPTGVEAIAVLIEQAPSWLRPNAAFVCEIGERQAEAVLELVANVGRYASAEVLADLAGRPRVLVARAPT